MKVLATLGLTLASSTAFAGVVYVATPFVEELCKRSLVSPLGQVGLSDRYFGGTGSSLEFREDGSYTHSRTDEEPAGAWNETGAWTVDGTRIQLRSEAGDVRTLERQKEGGLLLLETGESLWPNLGLEWCDY